MKRIVINAFSKREPASAGWGQRSDIGMAGRRRAAALMPLTGALVALSVAAICQPALAAPDWSIQIAPPAGIQWQRPVSKDTLIRKVSPAPDAKFGFVQQESVQNFNRHLAEMRGEIATKLSSGQLSASDASQLNAKLDGLTKLEYQYQASGGITQPQLSQLYLNLRNVRVGGSRNSWFF